MLMVAFFEAVSRGVIMKEEPCAETERVLCGNQCSMSSGLEIYLFLDVLQEAVVLVSVKFGCTKEM